MIHRHPRDTPPGGHIALRVAGIFGGEGDKQRLFSPATAAEINQAIAAAVAGEKESLLVAHQPREDYRDPQHVPAGQKSMLWSFVYTSP